MTNILCVGSAVLDITFQLPEMPSSTTKYVAEEAAMVGGGIAANAAVAIQRLGGCAYLAGQLGNDIIGKTIIDDLHKENINVDFVTITDHARSAFSSVYIDAEGDRQIVNFRGQDLALHPQWLTSDLTFAAVLVDTRIPEAALQALDMANDQNVPGIVDGEAPIDTRLLYRASHVAFSRQGLVSLYPDTPLSEALLLCSQEYDIWGCVTDGGNSIHYTGPSGIEVLAAIPVNAIDTLAAGDIWHGAFALSLANDDTELAAMQFANAAAAYKCTQPNGRQGAPTKQQLDQFIKEQY